MLKTGVRAHSIELVDEIIKTCCALHNFLLEADGMDITWEGSSMTMKTMKLKIIIRPIFLCLFTNYIVIMVS